MHLEKRHSPITVLDAHDEVTLTFCRCCCCYFILCLTPALPGACGSFVCLLMWIALVLSFQSNATASDAKLALFFDWLVFDDKRDNIMNIGKGANKVYLFTMDHCLLFNLYLILMCCIRMKIFHSCLVCCRSEIPTEIYPFPWYFCDCVLLSRSFGFWKEPVAWWCIESLKLRQNVLHFRETSGIQSLKFRQHFTFDSSLSCRIIEVGMEWLTF